MPRCGFLMIVFNIKTSSADNPSHRRQRHYDPYKGNCDRVKISSLTVNLCIQT